MRVWLADIRTSEKKTQQEVADAAGISQSYYAGIESGFRGKALPVPLAKKIAAVLCFDWTRFYDEGEAGKDSADEKAACSERDYKRLEKVLAENFDDSDLSITIKAGSDINSDR